MFKVWIYADNFYFIKNEATEQKPWTEEYVFTKNWWGDGRALRPGDDKYWDNGEAQKIWEESSHVSKSFFGSEVSAEPISDKDMAVINKCISAKDEFFNKINNSVVKPLVKTEFVHGGAFLLVDEESDTILYLDFAQYVYPILKSVEAFVDEYGFLDGDAEVVYFWDLENEIVYLVLQESDSESGDVLHNYFMAAIKPCSIENTTLFEDMDEFQNQISFKKVYCSPNAKKDEDDAED